MTAAGWPTTWAATEGFLLDLPTICEHYLFGSEDFLGGLLALMQPRPNTLQLPRFALYPLIRGVIESSGQTAWVLGPAADQSARFRRLLQLQMDELRHDRKYIKAHTHPRDDDPPEIRSFTNKMRRTEVGKLDIRRKGLLDAAAHLNIAQAEIEDGVSGGYAALIRETVDEQAVDTHWHGRQGAGPWMFISGLSHPSMSRAWCRRQSTNPAKSDQMTSCPSGLKRTLSSSTTDFASRSHCTRGPYACGKRRLAPQRQAMTAARLARPKPLGLPMLPG